MPQFLAWATNHSVQNVGAHRIKSESFIQGSENGSADTLVMRRMHKAHQSDEGGIGGFICREVKLALAFRMLASGSYLDISLIFEVQSNSPARKLHNICGNWFNKDNIANFNASSYLHLKEHMANVAAIKGPFSWMYWHTRQMAC